MILVHSTARPLVYSPWVQPRRQFSIIKEEKQLKEEIQELNPQETEEIFRIEKSWEQKGKIEGKIEGIIEGEINGKIKVARRMLASGMSLEDIMRFTELPREVIERQVR
jgi:predicted transposase/invertase (TIGR01784 family)